METNATPPGKSGRRELAFMFLAIGIVLLVVAYFVGISDNPPGIIAMLLGGFLLITGGFYMFAKRGARTPGQELLYWAPRALCITCALFVSIFALDVFSEAHGFWQILLALFMHLIPTWLILLLLWVSWRREWIGAVFFIVLAIVYVVSIWGRPFFWTAGPLISGPFLLVGALFFLNWRYRSKLRGSVS
jgi:hypothetical protein